MAKKRGKARIKRPLREVSRKSKDFDKRLIPIAILAGFVLLVLVLAKNEVGGKIVVTQYHIEEGDKMSCIYLNMKHTFSDTRECFAEIKLFQEGNMIATSTQNLGYITPYTEVSRTIDLWFPDGETNFTVDIDCK